MDIDKKTAIFIGGALITSAAFYCWITRSSKTSKDEDKHTIVRVPSKFDALEKLISEGVDSGWDVIKQTDTLHVYKKDTGDSPVAIIKADIIFQDTSVDDVLFAIWDGDFRRSWDNVAQDFHVVDKTDEYNDIIYFFAKSPVPMLVSNREFVQHRMYKREGDKVLVIYWSADRPDIPTPDGWIRANTIISGYIIEPGSQPGEVIVNFITQNDVKGSIPPKLINTFAPSKALSWVKELGKACRLLKKRRNLETN